MDSRLAKVVKVELREQKNVVIAGDVLPSNFQWCAESGVRPGRSKKKTKEMCDEHEKVPKSILTSPWWAPGTKSIKKREKV